MTYFSDLDCLGASISAPSIDDVRLGNGVLQKGMAGAAVTSLQQLLGMSGSDADGDFGPKTEAAVKKFQTSAGLKPADGIARRDTISALDERLMSGGVQTINFSDSPEVVTAKMSAVSSAAPATRPTQVNAAKPIPGAKILAEKFEPYRGPSLTTYAAYGLGGLAAVGLGYAILKR